MWQASPKEHPLAWSETLSMWKRMMVLTDKPGPQVCADVSSGEWEKLHRGSHNRNKCEWDRVSECHPHLGRRPLTSKESSVYAKASRWALNEEHDVYINYWCNLSVQKRDIVLTQWLKLASLLLGHSSITLLISLLEMSTMSLQVVDLPQTHNLHLIREKYQANPNWQIVGKYPCVSFSKCQGHGKQSPRESLNIKEGSACNS